MEIARDMGAPASPTPISPLYAKYVLGVLMLTQVLNFIDRQIISILAEEIKADLGVTDAQIGFLYGTAFAVFFSVFGIPLGRLADAWVRTRLIALGIAFWSVMTALSGLSRNFATLAALRIGVGVGEATAGPSSNSLVFDYFPPKVRATAIAVYASGIYIGAGIGIFLGGAIVDAWNGAFPDHTAAPLGLKGWQAAYLAVGLPGLLVALIAASLREPERGRLDGIAAPPPVNPWKALSSELLTIVPPLTVIGLAKAGGRTREFAVNAAFAAFYVLAAWGLTRLLGDPLQWVSLAIGLYAATSWAQSLVLRDRPTFRLTFGCRTFCLTMVGFACVAFVTYGVGFWTVPLLIRAHGVTASVAGTNGGLAASIGGLLGVTLGGVLADRLAKRTDAARYVVGMAAVISAIPVGATYILTDNLLVAYIFLGLWCTLSSMWIGPASAAILDLVLPRMRAVASAIWIFMNTFIGLALGPFTIGRVSDAIAARTHDSPGALTQAMLYALAMVVVAVLLLFFATRSLRSDMAKKLDRARAAGEEL